VLSDAGVSSGLSIGELAARTGVAIGTLRMWQTRHGFPSPARLVGGHRRYSQRDADLVAGVLALREQGFSLAVAITRAQNDMSVVSASGSVFAGLLQRRGDLQRMTLCKPALLALTRALEDEHLARGAGGVLVGSFQRARFYRQSQRRWQELARTARLAVAVADFRRLREEVGRPVEVPLARDHPLAREWAIAFHAPASSGCLAAWEIPQTSTEQARRFEVLWSPEPHLAHLALTLLAETIKPLAAAAANTLSAALAPAGVGGADLRAAASQAQRMIAYLSAQHQ
jgi:MerR family transcriptional regulator, light-induced transcriptional regulator